MAERDDPGAAVAAAHATPLAQLLLDCQSPAGHYDELRDGSGALRPHWAAFVNHTPSTSSDDLSREQRRIVRQLHENGVTFNVHATGETSRPWSLDVLPHIIPAGDWTPLAEGLKQRARLLELVLRDLYGPQRTLADGLIPPPLVLQHPWFLHQVHGVEPASGRFLHVLAFDVARGPDGQWRVLDVKAQAPSGSGYALENRLAISQLFQDAFRDERVCLLAPYFRTLRETLLDAAPPEQGPPHLVLLTPGPHNETYVEQAYLARYLGLTLAEGADLAVRDDRVYLKTVAGLRRVHGILRRLDDVYADPLELRVESTIGVPGLVQAWRSGHVCLANALGAGIVESTALQASLPALSHALLGEPLALPPLDVVWCGDDRRFEAGATLGAGDNEASFVHRVIRPAFPDPGEQAVLGPRLDGAARRAWSARIQAAPERFLLEEYVPLSHVPAWDGSRFVSRAVVTRVFVVADGRGDFAVMSGGLARIGGDQVDLVSAPRGGSSKDTWVLSDRPIERVSLLRGRLSAADIAATERLVSSRAAEHLFWMGRYAERSENTARLMRAVLTRLYDGTTLVSSDARPVVRACAAHGLLGAAGVDGTRTWLPHEFARRLMAGLSDPETFHSVAFNVTQTRQAAGAVRDRLSIDNWRELNRLADRLPRPGQIAGLPQALDLLDRVIMSLVAVGGLEMAHMTRDDGWRFLSLGRHLERLSYVAATVGEVARSESPDDPRLLEWLLDLSDGLITYRSRYMGRAEWLAVADLLLLDPRNPRSAVFQLAKMSKHVPLLPAADLNDLVSTLEQLSARWTGDSQTRDLFPDLAHPPEVPERHDSLAEFIESSERVARQLSDALTLRYFSHAYEASHTLL